MNCKPGDVAMFVRIFKDEQHAGFADISQQLLGRVVKCVMVGDKYKGEPVWVFEDACPVTYNGRLVEMDEWFDYCLKPLPKLDLTQEDEKNVPVHV